MEGTIPKPPGEPATQPDPQPNATNPESLASPPEAAPASPTMADEPSLVPEPATASETHTSTTESSAAPIPEPTPTGAAPVEPLAVEPIPTPAESEKVDGQGVALASHETPEETENLLPPLPEGAETVEVPTQNVPLAWQQSSLGTKAAKVSPPPHGHARHTKLFMIILLVLLVLVGGSTAAYFDYYLPNQPDNKLEQAFLNLAQKQQISINGNVDVSSTSKQPTFPGVSVVFNLGADLQKTELATSGTVGVSGSQFPFDVRYVNQNIYFKVGGLDLLGNVLPKTGTASAVNPYLKVLSSVNNQWYVIDQSITGDLGSSATCVTSLSYALNNNDIKLIKSAYNKDPLFTVSSTSPATIDGIPTTKMQFTPPSDAATRAFANQLTSLSVVQNINKCLKGSTTNTTKQALGLPSKVNSAGETLYAFVTGNKQLKELQLVSTSGSLSDKIILDFNNNAPNIAVPSGAKPIQNLVSSYLNSGVTSSVSGLSN